MKTLELVISLEGLNLNEVDSKKTSQELVMAVIKNLMLGWGSQQQKGFNEEERRKFYKISDAFEKAIKDKAETIELEDDWFGFIRKCKREVGILPNDLIRRIEDLIDGVKDR
jgi:hypothetical protein